MKPPCATFSDSRHAVPTQSTTENWTTKSLLFRWIILKTSTITYSPASTLYNEITFSLQL